MRAIVSGTRKPKFPYGAVHRGIHRVLLIVREGNLRVGPIEWVHGGHKSGVDKHADMVLRTAGFEPLIIRPDWLGPCDADFCEPNHRRNNKFGDNTWCPAAGIRRNRAMIRLDPKPDFLLAFPDAHHSPGTWSTVEFADRAGVDVFLHDEQGNVIPRERKGQ